MSKTFLFWRYTNESLTSIFEYTNYDNFTNDEFYKTKNLSGMGKLLFKIIRF